MFLAWFQNSQFSELIFFLSQFAGEAGFSINSSDNLLDWLYQKWHS